MHAPVLARNGCIYFPASRLPQHHSNLNNLNLNSRKHTATMSSTIIDLTQDSPSMYSTKENLPFPLNAKSANVTISSYHSTRLPPLSEVLNYAQPPSARPQWTKPIVSIALEDAIDTMDEKLLRNTVKEYCATLPELREGMEKFLVRGRDVVQYHDDTESEGDVESEEENEEQEEHEDVVKVKKPIAIGDDDFTPRFAECEYCNEKFDVSSNNYRTCYWHTGNMTITLYTGHSLLTLFRG